MNSLHKVVYQIAANPSFLAEIAQGSRTFLKRFDLSPSEAGVLMTLLQDKDLLRQLLNVEAVSSFLNVVEEQIWVPPSTQAPQIV